MEDDFLGRSSGTWKGSPVLHCSGTECSKREIRVSFLQAIFDTTFRPSQLFFNKWKRIVQKRKRGDSGTKFTGPEFLRTIRPNRQRTGCPMNMVNNQCFGLLTLLNGD